jgi:formate hydrogenlyase subunit 6/NADH:ubiquinone oxidoreductase subunit I
MNNKTILRKVRLVLASLSFVFLTLIIIDFTGTLHSWLGWVAKIQFLPAILALNFGVVIALVVVTLIFGRIYCSVVCPLGVFQDIVAWSHNRYKRNRYTYSKAISWLRYTMLGIMIAAFILGIGSIVALLEPYSSYGRIAGNLFQPVYEFVNNGLAAIAKNINSYAFYSVDIWIKSLPTFIIAVVTLIAIVVLAWRSGRTYCNTICPVGTILSFFSRFSWLKIHIDSNRCIKCNLCSKNCKASCIDTKNDKIDYSRCVVCGDCISKCHKGAISYSHKTTTTVWHSEENIKSEHTQMNNADRSKRLFLFGAAMATTSAVIAQGKNKVDGGLATIKDKIAPERQTIITPPGSLSAANMAKHCTGCQLCVSECPNEVLRPSTDLTKLMQPVMSYERGYCRPECTRCSDVCPAGAIKPITRAEKSSTQIGHAVWIMKNCIALNDKLECGNCARHCPVGAITMVPSDSNDPISVKIPTINEARCIGCGTCENLCPARPFSAIYVEGHEVHKTI